VLQILAFGVALSFAAQDVPIQHVRSSEPRILALINTGLARSATIRRLVGTLNESDVIVYIETQVTRESRQVHRESLDAYLIHHVVDQGGHRYLRIGLGARGAEKRLIPILAHELQHAVEIARAPEVRDDERLRDFFSRTSLSFNCAGMCYETQEAKDIQGTVNEELAEHAANSRSDAQTRFWFSRRWPSSVTRHTMHGSREGMAMSFYPGRSDEAPGNEV
jgi:hypothetical protein